MVVFIHTTTFVSTVRGGRFSEFETFQNRSDALNVNGPLLASVLLLTSPVNTSHEGDSVIVDVQTGSLMMHMKSVQQLGVLGGP